METKRQFQNLTFHQTPENYADQPTLIQPTVTPNVLQNSLFPFIHPTSPLPLVENTSTLHPDFDNEQETSTQLETIPPDESSISPKKRLLRGIVLIFSVLLALTIFLIWRTMAPDSTAQAVSQQNFTSSVTPQSATGTPADSGNPNSSSTIQVYILGAIKHPGVYTLANDARVYQLVQAAGGTLPNANTVALNLAAKLTDGEEIYVLSIDETPPANINNPSSTTANRAASPTTAQPVNINTATEATMEQILHVSAATAKKIIDYRTQHGPYTAINQLLQVISQSIYDRIKNMVTVS